MKRKAFSDALLSAATAAAFIVLAATTVPNRDSVRLEVPDVAESDLRSWSIHGGTPDERARMEVAIERFALGGLALPQLRIDFAASSEKCKGGIGHFEPLDDVWRIAICSTVDSVYEHELAHAWERATLTDTQRVAFVAFRGLPTWSDKSYDWNQRGVEWAALVIQQGLGGLPLPPNLGLDATSRLEGYEMLTGRAAPRLAEWLARYDVPCDQRPTEFSLRLPDASGLTCEGDRTVLDQNVPR